MRLSRDVSQNRNERHNYDGGLTMEYFYDIWLISVENCRRSSVFKIFTKSAIVARLFITNRNKKHVYDSGLSIKDAHKV